METPFMLEVMRSLHALLQRKILMQVTGSVDPTPEQAQLLSVEPCIQSANPSVFKQVVRYNGDIIGFITMLTPADEVLKQGESNYRAGWQFTPELRCNHITKVTAT